MHSVTVMTSASMATQQPCSQPTSPILPQQNTPSLLTSLVSGSPTAQQSVPFAPNQQYTQSQSAQFTPPDSVPSTPKQGTATNAPASSTNSNSPSSPRGSIFSLTPHNLPAHIQSQVKQLRTPRSPMYVPAVLRPTEKPIRSSPPKSKTKYGLEGSIIERRDSGDGRSIAETEGPGAAIDEDTGFCPRDKLKRTFTEEWRWANSRVGEVVDGPPARSHWKPDSAASICDLPDCSRPFSLFVRRHHCRRCGGIFCAEHSAYFVPLDQRARFSPAALGRYRACEDCWKDYGVWETERVRRANETIIEGQESQGGSGRASLDIPSAKKTVIGVIAQSVPRDWSWSTF